MHIRPFLLAATLAFLLTGCDWANHEEDGPVTWTNAGPRGVQVVSLGAGPGRALYLTTPYGLYRRAETEVGWSLMHGPEVTSPLFVTGDGTVITGRSRGGLRVLPKGRGDWVNLGDAFRLSTDELRACGRFAVVPLALTPSSVAQGPEGTLYAATICGIYASAASGLSWSRRSFADERVVGVAATEDAVWALLERGLYKLVGSQWQAVNFVPGARTGRFETLATDGAGMIVVQAQHAVYTSADGGATWSPRPAFPADPAELVVADGAVWLRDSRGRLYQSADAAASWQRVEAPEDLVAFAVRGGTLTVAQRTRIYTRNASGSYEEDALVGLDEQALGTVVDVDGAWIASGEVYRFRTTDNGRTWTRLPNDRYPYHARVAAQGAVYAEGTRGGLYRSDDRGETWTLLENAPAYVRDGDWIALDGGRLVIRTSGQFVASSDRGETWEPLDPPAPPHRIATYGGVLYVTDERGRVWAQQTATSAWTPINAATLYWPSTGATQSAQIAGFAAGPGGALYAWSDLGQLAVWAGDGWQQAQLPSASIFDLFVRRDGTLVGQFGGASFGLLRSRDNGRSWQRIDDQALREVGIRQLHETETGILLAATNRGVFVATE